MATQKKISELTEVVLIGDDDFLEVSIETGPSAYASRKVKTKHIIPSGVVVPSSLVPSGVVLVTGDQNIGGVKTFESFPVTPSGAPTTDLQVANKKYVDDLTPSGVVFTSGDQTVNGVKTFGSFPITPSGAPTTDYQMANKKYVDDNAGGGGTADWTLVSASKYTATPASTSVITMSDTSNFKVGRPVKYTYNSNTYWGRIQALTTNTSITIQGPALNTGQALTALYAGKDERQTAVPLFVAGTFGDSADAYLLSNDMNSPAIWAGTKAYLVAFKVTEKGVDSGTEPKVNVNIAGSAVSTNDSNKGLQLTTSGAWVSTGVDISASNYDISDGDAIELACTEAGGVGDAANLSVVAIFVLE